ncbi:MAG TPA: LytTR family DNA-binding domain-containing protein [Saprospiraceae bacterium]|nr:LytTR family DNA-binding domain-containing protein [Saprospiraceae bacterium]
MSKLKTIIIDDEKSSIDSLRFELKEYCPEVQIMDTCQDPVKAVELLQRLEPDLLFLDIEMPGMNGFELLQQLPEYAGQVIFVTAYDQFAINAFEFNAVDYLLKPVRKSKLIAAVQKVMERQNVRVDKFNLDALLQNIRIQSQGGLETIALPTSDGFKMVHINDIAYLQAESNYTRVHLADRKIHLVSKTLKDMEEMIRFSQYFRAHKSYLVNLNHVDRYIRGQGGYLVMKDQVQIPVARTQKIELLKMLKL